MRRKKHKQTRRAMRFYRIHYGFRPPYKVLLDGNFVHALEQMKRADQLSDLLGKLLGGPVRLFTTKCVMAELRSLGKEYSGTRQSLKRFALHKCGHDTHVSAAECLSVQALAGSSKQHHHQQQLQQDNKAAARGSNGGTATETAGQGQQAASGHEEDSEGEESGSGSEGEEKEGVKEGADGAGPSSTGAAPQQQQGQQGGASNGKPAPPSGAGSAAKDHSLLAGQEANLNKDHFFVATQDRGLQRRLMSCPGGAVLFASVNGVHLDTPSERQQSAAKAAEARAQRPSAAELASGPLREAEAERQRRQAHYTAASFRRKKAKGPNPLAVKPKQKKQQGQQQQQQGAGGKQQQQQQQQAGGEGGGSGGQDSQRKRKRRRGRGTAAAGGSSGGGTAAT